MAELFQLKVVTPERVVLQSNVVSVTAPGADGYFGVLAHHASMLAEIGVGKLVAQSEGGAETVMAVSGGFSEVRHNEMTVLADSAELKHEIDLARAEEALQRARGRLTEPNPGTDFSRAEAALARALNRLDVAAAK
jgi:F-type H+-transporting ATPase subunit epsilon